MNEDLVILAANQTGFTRWEIILMAVVVVLFGILYKVLTKIAKEAVEANNNSTNAINNNTAAFKEFRDQMFKEISKATKP